MMRILYTSILISFLIHTKALASDFIRLQKFGDRIFFHSKQFGPFWSAGIVTFMDDGANIPMKEYFKKNYSATLYENEFKRINELGFNTIGGWSNKEYLNNRMPWGKVLFDDPDHPLKWPLRDINGNPPPMADSNLPCPIGDPYDPEYIKALDDYLRRYVSPHKNDETLLTYWLGAEFGFGDTNAIDFVKYIYSTGAKKEFSHWLKTQGISGKVKEEDIRKFSIKMLSDWNKLVVSTIKKYDPNHLVSSPKISFWDYSPFLSKGFELGHFESWKNHFDIIAIDWYSKEVIQKNQGWEDLRKLSKYLEIPVLNSEFGIRQKIKNWTNTNGARSLVPDQVTRAKNYKGQMLAMYNDPIFVGAHWFRWQDHITAKQQMNKGLMWTDGKTLKTYEELAGSMKEVNSHIQSEVKRLTSPGNN